MRLFTCGLSVALLSFCFLGLTGCGEDNEAAVNELASKSKATSVPSDKVSPPRGPTMEDYAKSNPGSTPGATGSGRTRNPAPAAGKK